MRIESFKDAKGRKFFIQATDDALLRVKERANLDLDALTLDLVKFGTLLRQDEGVANVIRIVCAMMQPERETIAVNESVVATALRAVLLALHSRWPDRRLLDVVKNSRKLAHPSFSRN